MVEITLIVLSVLSLALTWAFKKPVKCVVLGDAVKQEVKEDGKAQDPVVEVPVEAGL